MGGAIDIGSQLVSALTHAEASHPWIERDPVSGVRSLKVALPPRSRIPHCRCLDRTGASDAESPLINALTAVR
jgi:hypothetical protein